MMTTARVPLIDPETGRFPDRFAPASVAADTATAAAAATTAVQKAADAETARAAAVTARDAAVVAQQAAEAVPAQVDSAMDGVLADPDSAASTRLSATFAAHPVWVDTSTDATAAFGNIMNVNTAAGNVTVTLPPAEERGSIWIRNTGDGVVTVLPPDNANDTIDGYSSATVIGYAAAREFVSNEHNRWRSGACFLPQVYVQEQIATAHAASGGNRDYCLVVPNQITTGSASDGAHDLVFIVGNNPNIGDADIRFERGDDNALGVVFMHMPIRSMYGLQIQDANGVTLLDFAQTSGDVALGGRLKGGIGANSDLVLKQGSAAGVTRWLKADGVTSLLVLDNSGNLTMSIPAAFKLANAGSVQFSMLSGGVGFVNSDSSNRVNIAGGIGGVRVLNNAASAANLAVADDGSVTLRSGVKVLSGAGSPEGAVTAPTGSTYQRTDGGAGTCFYVKESGTGNTGWIAK